jgi:hypothetical protein
VLELLWAEAQAGGVSLPALTFANPWHEGRLRESIGILRGLRNSSRRDGDRWRFRVDFGDLVAEGECAPALTAELDYESPDGRKLVCRNSKNGSMSVVLSGSTAAELRTEDAAAVEYAEDRA